MKPDEIKKHEDEFFSTLTTNKKKFTLKQTTDIGNNIKIYSIRPSYSSYYHATQTKKKSICLHFTVGYIKSDISTLTQEDNHVSVSYVVDRSGRIYELFPDTDWSFHLGKDAIGKNEDMSKQSIGIEISNYGPLTLYGNQLKTIYPAKAELKDRDTYCEASETEFYYKHSYKGYDYYASMTDIQTEAVAALIKYLSRKHNIPMNFMESDRAFASAKEATSFKGIFYHTNVRSDKYDWPYGPALKAVIAACSNELPNKVESKPDATKTEIKNEEPLPEVKPETPPEQQSQPQPTQQQETKVEPKPATKPAPTTSQANSSTGKKSFIQAIIEFIMQLFGKKK